MHWHIRWIEQGAEVESVVRAQPRIFITIGEILLDETDTAITILPCEQVCRASDDPRRNK